MIILVGPSASGKTEIAKELQTRYSMKKVITHTTRPIRKHETPEVDYHFVTEEAFLKLKAEAAFVETTVYQNHFYGTSKTEIGKNKVLIVDPMGMRAFLSLLDASIVIFFLEASEATRVTRMKLRGDSEVTIEKRLLGDRSVFDENAQKCADYLLSTDTRSLPSLAEEIFRLYQDRLQG